MNSTIFFLFKELNGRSNLGEGVLDTAVYEAKNTLLLSPALLDSSQVEKSILLHKVQSVFTESGIDPKSATPISEQEPNPLPDRAALDKVVFDALDLIEDERKEVYRAVCQLVWNRISKAKSV